MLRSVLLLGLLVIGNCRHASDASDSQRPQTTLPPTGTVIFQPPHRPDAAVKVWIARTEDQREKGLMWVKKMPEDAGMIFLFDDDDVRTFWMKNTLIPLDMIFVDADKVVAGVVENAEPLTLTTRTIGKPSRYVVEVNAGWARTHGVDEGTPCIFREVNP